MLIKMAHSVWTGGSRHTGRAALPHKNIHQAVDKSAQEFQTTSAKILLGQAKQAFPFYDLTIDENAYAQMEITLSPKISAGNRLIINSLIEKYNPSAVLH